VKRNAAKFVWLARFALALGISGFAFIALPMPISVSLSDVARIEAQVGQNPCVHSLKDWNREYVFRGQATVWPNTDLIDFSYSDPKLEPIEEDDRPSGISRPWRPSRLFRDLIIDDRPQRAASGTLDRKTGEIRDFRCGCSMALNASQGLPVCIPAQKAG
jgi:hypothetical protein